MVSLETAFLTEERDHDMGFEQRSQAIRRLEEVRGSKVLVHFLSDRRVAMNIPTGMATALAGEPYRFIYEHVRAMRRPQNLDLFLHTSGGHLDSVWPLVSLCRSVCGTFSVLVPMRALSGGTLLCLGADKVLMCEPALLSPIDPSTANAFNPKDKDRPIPISVEDVTSYFDLARGDEEGGSAGVGLKSDEHILEIFKALTAQVHPLALGNVKRVHSQIRDIARRLLELHVTGDQAEERINAVVGILTEKLYSHAHQINRAEALEILGSDMLVLPSPEEEAAMWDLYRLYEDFFELTRTFNLKDWMGDAEEKELEAIGGVIESDGMSHLFKTMSKVRRISELPSGAQVQIAPGQRMPIIPGLPVRINLEPIREGWYSNEEGI